MLFNARGQLCLRLFDFEDLQSVSHVTVDQWRAKKIIGDECQVFMLQQSESKNAKSSSNNFVAMSPMSFVTLIGSVVKTTINIQCLVQQSHVTHMSQ